MADDPLITAFRVQLAGCRLYGSPLYEALCERILEDLAQEGPVARLLRRWEGDPVHAFLPLRLFGAVHDRALAGAAPALAACYPTCGGTADAAAAWPAFRDVVEADAARLRPRLENWPQTNEVRRCAGLLGGFLHIARATGRPLRLFEIGCSAGLNLQWARYGYRLGPHAWGPPDAQVRIEAEWTGAAAAWDAPVVVESRSGCDLDPRRIESEADVRQLESFIWPDQPERLEQLRAAIAVARNDPPRIDAASALPWLSEALARPAEGVCRVVYHSAFWLYLSPDEQAGIRRLFAQHGAAATEDTPIAWLRHENVERVTDIELRVQLWPDGRDLHLGMSHPHGRQVEWFDTPRGRDGLAFLLHGPDQAFLHHRGHQAAVTGEETPGAEGARGASRRALLRVEQPLIGTEGVVEPHGVIERGHLVAIVEPRNGVGQHGGVEQRHVRGVGCDALVEARVVAQRAVGADPHVEPRRHLLRVGEVDRGDVARIDGALLVDPLEVVRVARHRAQRLEALGDGGQALGRRHVGHLVLMLEAALGPVEGGLHVEDGLALLHRDDAPRGEGAPVLGAIHLEEDRHARIARAQEVGVEAVEHLALVRRGARGGDHGLAHDLAAEDALASVLRRVASEVVDFDRFEIEELYDFVEGLLHGGWTIAGRGFGAVRRGGGAGWGRPSGEWLGSLWAPWLGVGLADRGEGARLGAPLRRMARLALGAVAGGWARVMGPLSRSRLVCA